jgi:hypothetical protein
VRKKKRIIAFALLTLAAVGAIASESRTHELSRPIETDPASAARNARECDGEAFEMRWKLSGFLGALVGLFVPNHGDALLTFVPGDDGKERITLLITTPKREGEYFLYGAEVEPDSGTTAAVWSAYRYKDKAKGRETEIDEPDVIDLASGIYHLRLDPPTETIRATLWNDGDRYLAEVEPLEPERRKISGHKLEVQGFRVRGVKAPGQKYFEDTFTVYFTRGGRGTPVAIIGKRGMLRLRIELIEEQIVRLGLPPAS